MSDSPVIYSDHFLLLDRVDNLVIKPWSEYNRRILNDGASILPYDSTAAGWHMPASPLNGMFYGVYPNEEMPHSASAGVNFIFSASPTGATADVRAIIFGKTLGFWLGKARKAGVSLPYWGFARSGSISGFPPFRYAHVFNCIEI